MSISSHHSRKGYKKESSPNLLPRPDDWESIPSSPGSGGLSDKYSLSPDPALWGSNLSPNLTEPDDALHNPEFEGGKIVDRTKTSLSSRGIMNIGCLVIICLALLALFMGYPVISFIEKKFLSPAVNSVTVNATGQVASIGNFGLIDLDTPANAYTLNSLYTGKEMKLVFSDEFNTDGRSFYPGQVKLIVIGDDPYWEAVDLHYWATNNMEWYDPGAVTTRNGALEITLSATPTKGLDYQGGGSSHLGKTVLQNRMALQLTGLYRNKFCFTGGLVVTSATLPGTTNIHGLWPAFWTMGNLGRAGYGASLDGMWPYTYDACDVGTAPNQTRDDLPAIALTSGSTDEPYNGELSYLTGQRLSRCTCSGESHPGPIHSDGTYVGRSAPEIDVFEAQIQNEHGAVSQSGQWAPFNAGYVWFNTSDTYSISDPTISTLNTYIGGAYQQATSVVTQTNQGCYELTDKCLSVYGIEYKPGNALLATVGFDNAYISWITDNKVAWTIQVAGLAADPRVETSGRPVPQEPMYILANLGMSTNFGFVDVEHITFPTTLRMDYVRVYQYPDSINIGCDPPDFPTSAYINTYIEAYTNPNLTTWVDG
ncbi:beta-glucan synthesis-associated [Mycena sp. CBHHK59/15]|nr:beta-glucan synthesis-associated [Mycena sp. CBHHK59/15]